MKHKREPDDLRPHVSRLPRACRKGHHRASEEYEIPSVSGLTMVGRTCYDCGKPIYTRPLAADVVSLRMACITITDNVAFDTYSSHDPPEDFR